MRAREGEDTPSPPASAPLKRQTATSYLRVTHHSDPVRTAKHIEQTAFAKGQWASFSDLTLQDNPYQLQHQHSEETTLPSIASVDVPKVWLIIAAAKFDILDIWSS